MKYVFDRTTPDAGVGIAQRAKFVFLILKESGVDSPGLHAILLRQPLHFRHTLQTAGKIPQHV